MRRARVTALLLVSALCAAAPTVADPKPAKPARVVLPPVPKADDSQAIPGIGYFAACTDPEGNPFSLYKDDPSAKMEQAEQEARA